MLTETAVRNAKATDKPRKFADERGLYLLVHPNGSHYWRFKYRHDGKEKLLALGVYPDVTLKRACEMRDEACWFDGMRTCQIFCVLKRVDFRSCG